MRRSKPTLCLLALLLVSACGGGGTGGGGTNAAPVFTSPDTATAAENTTGVVYTAAASDADGDALSFALAGGADAALLQISPAGALSFRAPPDFEVPADANRDNVYEVTISVSDGRATATRAVRIAVTDSVGGGFTVR